ncbi:MAG TPA: hypothetical protein VK576_11060, partial [Thermoleophilia bacterium]|nr:hypothetical protein [Thermoleophilia bacterium]
MATYIVAVAAAAIVLAAATASTFPSGQWLDLAIFVAAGVASERWAVQSSVEGSMSLSLTVTFAAAILFGPAFAAVVVCGGVLVSDLVIDRRRWTKIVFNCSQLVVSAILAGVVFSELATGDGVSLSRDALAIAVSAAVFLLVNNTLVTGVIALQGRSFIHDWT